MRSKIIRFTRLAACVLLVSGCAWRATETAPLGSKPAVPIESRAESPPVIAHSSPAPTPHPTEKPQRIEGDDLWTALAVEFTLATPARAEVAQEVLAYRRQQRFLGEVSARAEPYLFYLANELRQRQMPLELALLPILESGYNPSLASPHGAAGLWQLMGGTGTKLGLQSSPWLDQRLDIVASTTAALNYLQSMQRHFDGDWLLTIAAYNAGAGTIDHALDNRGGAASPRDVWSLELTAETRRLVARWLALCEIFHAPAHHGIRLATVPNRPYFSAVALTQATDLARLAALAKVAAPEFARLNPGFHRGHTGPALPVKVLLPVAAAESLSLPTLALAARAPPAIAVVARAPAVRQASSPKPYTIRRGDSLWTVARRFDLHVADLERLNGLRRASPLHLGQRIKLGEGAQAARAVALARAPTATNGLVRYRVRSGDSWWTISRQFKVTVPQLLTWNKLDSDHALKPGQQILVYRQA